MIFSSSPYTLPSPPIITQNNQDWSVLILPDLQYYSAFFPHQFEKISEWIKRHHQDLNLKMIWTVGDNVDVNTSKQWTQVQNFYAKIHQLNIPTILCMGNHDFHSKTKIRRLGRPTSKKSLAKDFINFKQLGLGLLAGEFPTSDRDAYNYCYTFQMDTTKWLILSLAWDPSDKILDQCDQLIAENPNYRCILITHSYMESTYKRMCWDTSPLKKLGKVAALFQRKGSDSPRNKFFYKWPPGNTSNDGETIWKKLVKKHKFYFVLSGHVKGIGHRFDLTEKQTACCQMSINYQSLKEGGMGIFRVLTFTSNNKIKTQSFAPHKEKILHSVYFKKRTFGKTSFEPFTKESTLIKGPRHTFNIDFSNPQQLILNQHIKKNY